MTSIVLTEAERSNLAEAERCIDVAHGASDDALYERISDRAYQLLKPLVQKGVPQAQYLYACHMLGRESDDKEEITRRHIELIRTAAEAGHARAQFQLGQMYDSGGELDHDAERSAHWFRLSAEQGDPYAQWVHGLNLLWGQGIAQDQELGITFISLAAKAKFEGAMQFLAEAHAQGIHGLARDDVLVKYWNDRLRDPDVIPF